MFEALDELLTMERKKVLDWARCKYTDNHLCFCPLARIQVRFGVCCGYESNSFPSEFGFLL